MMVSNFLSNQAKPNKFIVAVVVVLLIILIVNNTLVYQPKEQKQNITPKSFQQKQQKAAQSKSKIKVILVWNGRYGLKNWGFEREPRKPFVKRRCAVTNCVITDDKKRLRESDAVMFHMVDSLRNRPPYKLPNQRWVFFEHEPAWTNKAFKKWNGWFNWTMTYKFDNTTGNIPMQYGTVCKRYKPIKIDFKKIAKNKTKFAVWMVGNCHTTSKRENYARELMKYIPVDVYGGCTHTYNQTHFCSRSNEAVCREMLNTDYKFYLSFENSFVPGYITEKYFKCLGINIVPIVRGDGNYSLAGPPHSYINTKDFHSPKQLADYLKHLNKTDDEYIKYLKWKELYKANESEILDEDCQITPELSWCRLCRKLNDPDDPHHVYDDIETWWGTNRKPTDI